MRLRSKLAIRAAKLTSILIKKMKRGSGVTLPGYVARRIDPNILTAMAEQVRGKIIVTMGTNGEDDDQCDPVQGAGSLRAIK